MSPASARNRQRSTTKADRIMTASSKPSDHNGEPSRKRKRASEQPEERVEAKLNSSTTTSARHAIETAAKAAPPEVQSQLEKIEMDRNGPQAMMQKFEAWVQDFKAEQQEMHNKNEILEERVQKLEAQNKGIETKLSKHEVGTPESPSPTPDIETQRFGERVHELEGRNKQLEALLADQEIALQEAQAFVLIMDNNAAWAPVQDSGIGEQLNKLELRIRKFCEKNAKPFSKGAGIKTRYAVPDDIAKELWLRPTDGSSEGLTDKVLQRTDSWLILSAWMNSFLYSKIFGNPFFFASQLLRAERLYSNAADEISGLFEELKKNGSGDDLRLRCEMLRSLHPRGTSENAKETRERTLNAIQTTCYGFAKVFLASPAKKIMLPLDDHSIQDFCEIVTRLGTLSLELSTQKSAIELKRKTALPLDFKVLHPDMEANQLHECDLVDDHHELDGWRIMLVTCPALVLVGSSDGTDYDTRRVLKKAVVWMGEVNKEEVDDD